MRAETSRRTHVRPVALWVALFLAGAWGTAAVSKIGNLDQLAAVLDAAMLFPPWLSHPVAVAVVAWEAAIAVGLLIPLLRPVALWGATATLLVYLGFAAWRLVAGIEAPCQCFGPLLRSTPGTSLAVCVGLLIPTIFGLLAHGDTFHQGEGYA